MAKLQPHLLVKPVYPFDIHLPALLLQQHMDASITVAPARLRLRRGNNLPGCFLILLGP